MASIDPTSATWAAVHETVTAELDKHCRKIEGRGLDSVETEYSRGVIAACRLVLGLTGKGPLPDDAFQDTGPGVGL